MPNILVLDFLVDSHDAHGPEIGANAAIGAWCQKAIYTVSTVLRYITSTLVSCVESLLFGFLCNALAA